MIESRTSEWNFSGNSRFAVSRRVGATGKPDEENFNQGRNSVNGDVE